MIFIAPHCLSAGGWREKEAPRLEASSWATLCMIPYSLTWPLLSVYVLTLRMLLGQYVSFIFKWLV